MEISKLFMSTDVYEVRTRKDKCGVDLISEVLPFGALWYTENPGRNRLTRNLTIAHIMS
jgi:hypothetical protein